MLLLSKDEETGQHLTDEEVRDEAMTLFIAGHETTANAMAWSLVSSREAPGATRALCDPKACLSRCRC